MKKSIVFLLIASIFGLPSIPAFSESGRTEISCDMNVAVRSGTFLREDITTSTFIINDEYKNLVMYESGNAVPLIGQTVIFDNSEISIKGVNFGKNTKADFYINRKSGSISIRMVESNIWWGDTITDYKGYCRRMESQLF